MFDENVLVYGVSTRSDRTHSIKGRNAQSGGEIPIRTAAGAGFFERKAKNCRKFLSAAEERRLC
jgi:hypothetical protein